MFRGKEVYDNTWVHGRLEFGQDKMFYDSVALTHINKLASARDKIYIVDFENERFQVHNNTVGEYVMEVGGYTGDFIIGVDVYGILIKNFDGNDYEILKADGNSVPVDEFQAYRVFHSIHDLTDFNYQKNEFKLVRHLLNNLDVIVCKNTAAEILGLTDEWKKNYISVYSTYELGIPGVRCEIVEDLSVFSVINKYSLKITDEVQTLIDMFKEDVYLPKIFRALDIFYANNNDSIDMFVEKIPDDLMCKWKRYDAEARKHCDYHAYKRMIIEVGGTL